MRTPSKLLRLCQVIIVFLLCTACVSTKEATYFDGVGQAKFSTVGKEHPEPQLRPSDLLSISVSSPNLDASQQFNAPNLTATQASSAAGAVVQATGYLVDQDGMIQFPSLGHIKAAGLTKSQLQNAIAKQLTDKGLLIEPIVSVRYLNYKVSVLGEVARPSVLTIPNEQVSMLEAIGLAGDMTIYAKRNNVLLIRELENGERTTTRIDLTSNQLLSSPDYYLKPNDIIYVEPNKAKIASSGSTYQMLPIVLSALSFTAIVLDRLLR